MAVEYKVKTIFPALLVRALLILHNILAVWRVTITRDNTALWGLASLNILAVIETVAIIRYNGGTEWKWWCPCFLVYLLSTLPSIWLLQLSQYTIAVESTEGVADGSVAMNAQIQLNPTNPTATVDNDTMPVTISILNATTTESMDIIGSLSSLEESTWIVIIQESLVYILVFGRWWLPRGEVSREALSDLLLEYLAIASDIMELYAIFDEDVVQSNLGLTYAILTVWSISFFQFVPVLVHKKRYQHLESPRMKKITRACGEFFSQVVVTCLSVFLQDGPFLCLRLYIIIRLDLITYSLVFFVLKNIVTLMLLCYRMTILCIRLPCCYYDDLEIAEVMDVDFSSPMAVEKKNYVLRSSVSGANSPINPYLFYTKQAGTMYKM